MKNPKFEAFRKDLEACGVTMRLSWEARRDGRAVSPKKPADVMFYNFIGDGFTPAILDAVVLDYGEQGYNILFPDKANIVAHDIHAIANTPQHPLALGRDGKFYPIAGGTNG